MTDDILDRVDRILSEVTDGPWIFQPWGPENQNGDYAESILFDGDGETMVYGLSDRDGEFIAASRTLMPDVADSLRAARAENERLRAELEANTATIRNASDLARSFGPTIGKLFEGGQR